MGSLTSDKGFSTQHSLNTENTLTGSYRSIITRLSHYTRSKLPWSSCLVSPLPRNLNGREISTQDCLGQVSSSMSLPVQGIWWSQYQDSSESPYLLASSKLLSWGLATGMFLSPGVVDPSWYLTSGLVPDDTVIWLWYCIYPIIYTSRSSYSKAHSR